MTFEIRLPKTNAEEVLAMVRNHGLDGFIESYYNALAESVICVTVNGPEELENRVYAAAEEIRAFYGFDGIVVYSEKHGFREVRAISLDNAPVAS